MKRFGEFIDESLMDELTGKNISPKAIRHAKRMGLVPAGFGRFKGTGNSSVMYKVKGDTVIPIQPLAEEVDEKKKEENEEINQTNSALYQVSKQAETYRKSKDKTVAQVNQQLAALYTTDLYMPNEVDALSSYSQSLFGPINRYLYKGFDQGTSSQDAQQITDTISLMDGAFQESGAPMNFVVYAGLGPRYDYRKIFAGQDYTFRGFTSTSLDHDVATEMFMFTGGNVMVEIDIMQGQKAIYMGNITGKYDEAEVLLPRGTIIRVISGPVMVDAATLTGNEGDMNQIALFKCAIVG